MDKPKPVRPHCDICGRPMRIDTTIGVCRYTPECNRERKARLRRQAGVPPMSERGQWPTDERSKCTHPDGCPNLSRGQQGPCGMHAQRLRKTGQFGAVESGRRPLAVPAGTVFGRWTTLEESPRGTRSKTPCRCECGAEKRILTDSLKHGTSKSCGCLKLEIISRPRSAGYLPAGATFGRLVTLEGAVRAYDSVRVRCECGTETEKVAIQIKTGKVRSCGCLAREVGLTHGLSGHPLYSIWRGMIHRCENPADQAWDHYGGRGISVCERWRGLPDGLLNFAADLGPRPPGMSIDRLDNDGNYEKANVGWRSTRQQNQNRRSVRKLTIERDALAARLAEAEHLLAAVPSGATGSGWR